MWKTGSKAATNYLETHFGEDTSTQFNYLLALRAPGALSLGDTSRSRCHAAKSALRKGSDHAQWFRTLQRHVSGAHPWRGYLRAHKFEEAAVGMSENFSITSASSLSTL
jgi:hypothetical protein